MNGPIIYGFCSFRKTLSQGCAQGPPPFREAPPFREEGGLPGSPCKLARIHARATPRPVLGCEKTNMSQLPFLVGIVCKEL